MVTVQLETNSFSLENVVEKFFHRLKFSTGGKKKYNSTGGVCTDSGFFLPTWLVKSKIESASNNNWMPGAGPLHSYRVLSFLVFQGAETLGDSYGFFSTKTLRLQWWIVTPLSHIQQHVPSPPLRDSGIVYTSGCLYMPRSVYDMILPQKANKKCIH